MTDDFNFGHNVIKPLKGGPVERRIFGPPGTGKTTYLSQQIKQKAKDYNGALLVASFTKTAAKEIASRGLDIESERVGTLHAIAYRALGRPKLAETAEGVKIWNESQSNQHDYLTCEKITIDDPFLDQEVHQTGTDKLLRIYNNVRARGKTVSSNSSLGVFVKKWEDFKKQNALLDFTDLISIAYRDCKCPYPVAVGFFDEVQDFSPLEMHLVRKWGKEMVHIELAFDDDQALYFFKGSNPKAILSIPVPQKNKKFLRDSHRLPKKIKEFAETIIKHVSYREPKEFNPRCDGGVIEYAGINYTQKTEAVRLIEDQLRNYESVMLLASCSYMIRPILTTLKEEGILFHNGYRKHNGEWNPLRSTPKRVLNFLVNDHRVHGERAHSHTWETVWPWLEHIDSRVCKLKRGAKKECAIRAEDPEDCEKPLAVEDFLNVLGIEPPPRGDINWLGARILKKKRDAFAYSFQICRERGGKTLIEQPRLTVGTVHSVKGGESDCVILFPDMSLAANAEYENSRDGRDAMIRTFYVAATRAKEKLIICEPVRDNLGFDFENFGKNGKA